MKSIVLLAVLAVFGLALISGCATAGRSAGEIVDDSVITSEANAKIIADPDAHYFKIDVDSKEGNVVLSGYVNSQETHDRIVNKIRGIKGVKSVNHSRLRIEKK